VKISIRELYNEKPTGAEILAVNTGTQVFLDARNQASMLNRLPQPGELLFIWTSASFSSFALIPEIIKKHGKIEELYLSSFTVNMRITTGMIDLMRQGRIAKVWLFMSDTIEKRLPRIFEQLRDYCRLNPNLKVKYGWNHSKILLLKTGNQWYCLEGSGNFSETSRHEQYLFSNHPEIYEFRRKGIASQF
jgi:hypothetical protein